MTPKAERLFRVETSHSLQVKNRNVFDLSLDGN